MKNKVTCRLIFSAGLVVAVLFAVFGRPASAATSHTALISVNNAGIEGDAASTLSFISADGRFVVFQSDADNLVPGITSSFPQVYLRDLTNNTTSLISSNSGGTGAGNGISGGPTISADGSIIAFHSTATDLINGGISNPDNHFHIYIHNRTTGMTTLISTSFNSTTPCDGTSGSPYISGNGNSVAFHSNATDLVTGHPEISADDKQIYLRDLNTNSTVLISQNAAGEAGDNATEAAMSEVPSVSADGTIVAFHSNATNLVSGDNGYQIYVRDLTGGTATTTIASKNDAGTPGNGMYNIFPIISADGQYVVFQSNSTNLFMGGTNTGRYHVYLHDRNGSGTTTLLSKTQNGLEGNGNSGQPFISPDGGYVAFTSTAANLTSDNVDGTTKHIFVRDVLTSKTTLATVSSSGIIANNDSRVPSLSTDGKLVVFESLATNLTTPASSGQQIFVHYKKGMNLLFMILPQLAAQGAAGP